MARTTSRSSGVPGLRATLVLVCAPGPGTATRVGREGDAGRGTGAAGVLRE
jgi:hypothetical protein